MARLLIKTEGIPNRTLDLRMGANRIGRTIEDNDFAIPHKTISSLHCEVVVTNEGVFLRDCESTNGTFLNGEPVVQPVWLQAGYEMRLGDVELVVDNTDVHIFIPDYEKAGSAPAIEEAPPSVLPDGAIACPRHPEMAALFRCPHCHAVMCLHCVHILKRQGGTPHFLCKTCSQKCERIAAAKEAPKKKGLVPRRLLWVNGTFKDLVANPLLQAGSAGLLSRPLERWRIRLLATA